jgi:hypothetical protein
MPADPRAASDRDQRQAFANLIEATARDLRAAVMPAQMVQAIEGRLAAWEKADPDFAAVLRQVKGQAWSMESAHLRAVRDKIALHLDQNLSDVNRALGRS